MIRAILVCLNITLVILRLLWNIIILFRGGNRAVPLQRPIMVRNVDRTNNSGGAITHQVETNVYYKDHVERIRMDGCDLGKMEVILGMPWLQTHNPEINWETGEVKMTRCLPLCGRTRPRGVKTRKKITTLEKEKIIRWAIDNKEDWRKEEKIEEDYRKIEELVPGKFLK